MTLKLSYLSIGLGIAIAALQVFGLTRTERYAQWLRKFPRSVPLGVAFTLAATAWFLYYLSQESIADLSSFKPLLYVLFGGVGVATCIFVQDFLATRGFAVLLLLLAKLLVDTGRPHLDDTPWVLLVQGFAYVLVIAGMWLTISPWRMRDLINWATASQARLKKLCAIRLGFGLLLVALGFTAFWNLK